MNVWRKGVFMMFLNKFVLLFLKVLEEVLWWLIKIYLLLILGLM